MSNRAELPERSVRWYNNHADSYDKFSMGFDLSTQIKRFMKRFSRPCRILDLGCGSGRDIGSILFYDHQVYGLDLSESLLSLANRRYPERLIYGDMLELPLKTASFAGVWACASFVHLSPLMLIAVLRECYRVVAPGLLSFSVKDRSASNGEQIDGSDVPRKRKGEWYRDSRAFYYYNVSEITEAVVNTHYAIEELYQDPCFSEDASQWLQVIARTVG